MEGVGRLAAEPVAARAQQLERLELRWYSGRANDMPPTTMKLTSMLDARVANVVALGGGEGFATFAGTFDGRPAVLIDCGTFDGLLDEDDQVTSPVTVHVFDDAEARDAYIETMPRTPRPSE